MKKSTPIPTPPAWLWATIGERPAFWTQPHRLLVDVQGTAVYDQIIQELLTTGSVYFEDADMVVVMASMTAEEKKRLTQLKRLERAGWLLDSFSSRVSLYYSQQHVGCFSMQEMMSRGFYPRPAIASDRRNYPVYEEGQLVDCFVPIAHCHEAFMHSALSPTTPVSLPFITDLL
ncbi:hypothetical protein [Spirosoma koreense]